MLLGGQQHDGHSRSENGRPGPNRPTAPDGVDIARHIQAEAVYHGVSVRTVYRWLDQPDDVAEATGDRHRGRVEITTEHLTVLANTGNRRAAYKLLAQHEAIDMAYSTFCKALNRIQPARLQGALHGRPGVVNNRLYLKHVSRYINEVWHLDHTPADVRCYHPSRNQVIRPYLTVITDAYSGLLHAFLLVDPPNKETTAAALGEVATEHQIDGVTIGGLPDRLRFDNGGENINGTMQASAEALGIVIDPTMPYNSWQNGKAERAIKETNRRLSEATPGGLHHGKDDKGGKRWTEDIPENTEPSSVLPFAALTRMLAGVVLDLNRNVAMERLGGRTRLRAYAEDPTERQMVSSELLRVALLTAPKVTYRCGKQGIQFDRAKYLCAGMEFGRAYTIRHWPNRRDHVEVYSTDGTTYIGRAYSLDQMPKSEATRLLAQRSWVEKEQRAITAGVEQHRALLAAAEWDDEEGEPGAPIPRPRPKRPRTETETEHPRPTAESLAFLEQAAEQASRKDTK